MRDVEMIGQAVERFEALEQSGARAVDAIKELIAEIEAYQRYLTVLKGRAQGILERCRTGKRNDPQITQITQIGDREKSGSHL